jgi:hypothetical protein
LPILKQIGGRGHKIANFAEGEGDEKFADNFILTNYQVTIIIPPKRIIWRAVFNDT